MALLYATDVGESAWQRMTRDGVVVLLRPGVGHASTAERSAALRAASLAAAVPRRATLAGAAALWVHGWRADGAAPRRIDVAVPRGCHPDPPPGFFTPWWQFVTDRAACAAASTIGGVSVTDVGSALRPLLSRGDLGEALDAAWWALSKGRIDEASGTRAIATGTRGLPRQRALAAWNAVCKASGAA
ncbi:hypothetical protein [Demequina lutea]|uniref:Uncharacterized protein n=1 Tax=Demequina lutea TaxID=431489 RepID=A0A7Y9Z9M3_9MICO|nr:hypothetical protein [Demequina lutea]NYI41337.1 hypothetical protein [Demequina lutea]